MCSIDTLHCSEIVMVYLPEPLPEPISASSKRPVVPYSSLPELSKPFYIDPAQRSYRHQYANIYFVRLVELRPVVEQRAAERWAGVRGEPHPEGRRLIAVGRPPLLPRILNLQRGQLCYIVGTTYLDMPLKPNVLEDMARDVSSKLCAAGAGAGRSQRLRWADARPD